MPEDDCFDIDKVWLATPESRSQVWLSNVIKSFTLIFEGET